MRTQDMVHVHMVHCRLVPRPYCLVVRNFYELSIPTVALNTIFRESQ